jgi:hypothetical protein
VMLSDAQIAALSAAERRDLITRLERPIDDVLPTGVAARMRHVRLPLMIGGAIALVPWTIFLALTLPESHVVHNWPVIWVGFDIILIVLMASTAVLGLLRRQLLVLSAFATGVLLICDAWLDVMTAGPRDMWLAVLTAALAELPLAWILISGALRLVRMTMTRLWRLEPDVPLWRVPLLP